MFPRVHYLHANCAGTIADVYRELAGAAGLPADEKGVDLGARLLLAELRMHTALRTYPDINARVAELQEGENATLLAYMYPSAEAGPRSDKRECHVFLRCSISHIIPPPVKCACTVWLGVTHALKYCSLLTINWHLVSPMVVHAPCLFKKLISCTCMCIQVAAGLLPHLPSQPLRKMNRRQRGCRV